MLPLLAANWFAAVSRQSRFFSGLCRSSPHLRHWARRTHSLSVHRLELVRPRRSYFWLTVGSGFLDEEGSARSDVFR
jgi:hypothetical protein